MISKPIEASTLEEYYDKLYKLQSDAHKADYMLVHDEIKTRLKECDSYTEFGINQGATLAAAVLQNPKIVRAYDIGLNWYNQARSLFDQYTDNHSINYEVTECNSLDCNIAPVDLLYIDTLHKYNHLCRELALHSNKVKKFIICHDTAAKLELKRAIHEFVTTNKNWHIINDCNVNVGFTTISNKEAIK